MEQAFDLVIVGAGPAGLACAIEAKKRGLEPVVLEKGCLVNSIYNYPENMTFFTTAELLEIGEVPMIVRSEKPKRLDALKYYTRVAKHFDLCFKDFDAKYGPFPLQNIQVWVDFCAGPKQAAKGVLKEK